MIQRYFLPKYRETYQSIRRFVLQKVLHANDPPHRLALGAAIGMFITFTPLIGLQMLLVASFAYLLRANKAIGLPIVWISNPATLVPLYYSCYVVGRTILGHPPIARQWWNQLGSPPPGSWTAITFYWSKLVEIAAPLWVGCLVLGIVTAYPTYYIVLFGVTWYRRRWKTGSVESENQTPQSPDNDFPRKSETDIDGDGRDRGDEHDPLSADPLSADPLSADPLSAEPLSAEPLSAEPNDQRAEEHRDANNLLRVTASTLPNSPVVAHPPIIGTPCQ